MNRTRSFAAAALATAICLPGQTSLDLRLGTTITSYGSKAGTRFHAIVAAPVELDGDILMPAGTIVHGVVKSSRAVGMGFVRERASIELEFHQYELPNGQRFPFLAKLSAVDNARERVDDKGRIQGILAANNPQALYSGVWYRLKPDIFSRSVTGLTGAGGRVWTQFSMGPTGAAILLLARFTALKLPEPEIRLPKGTEMKAHLTGLELNAPRFIRPADPNVDEALAEWIQSKRSPVFKFGGARAGDVINVVITGTQAEVIQAFAAAGWWRPDELNRKSVSAAYRAFATQGGYSKAPVSKLFYEGQEPDLVFQKSFNTISKRHHIRLWRAEHAGVPVWLGAATQDVGIVFKSGSFNHKIEPQVDLEREKVANDLDFLECATRMGYVTRETPAATGSPADTEITTDGRATVLNVSQCKEGPTEPEPVVTPRLPGTKGTRLLRRAVLETRHYFTRGNAYYWVFRAFQSRRNRRPALQPPISYQLPTALAAVGGTP